MRKIVLIAAMVAVAVPGVTACASGPATTEPSQSAVAGDQTQEVCTEAKAVSATASATIAAKFNEGAAAVASGDQAKVIQIEADLRKTGTDWASKLTELSAKQIESDVKTVLLDSAETLTQLNDPSNTTSPTEGQAQLTEIVTNINTVCA